MATVDQTNPRPGPLPASPFTKGNPTCNPRLRGSETGTPHRSFPALTQSFPALTPSFPPCAPSFPRKRESRSFCLVTEAQIRARLRALTHVSLAHAKHRPAAVLIPIEPGRGVWLTRRSNNLPSHAGQVAFPGGKIDPADASPEAAALREAHEEIALNPADAEILGRMDDYITGTGFHITSILALISPGAVFTPAADEVEAVFCLPFETLLDPAAPTRRAATFRGEAREFWVWPEPNHFIWGATAEILVNLALLLKEKP